uniref:Integrase catalytic domain-containing protein n=1 Tax=Tanacetum cinerariifolium TaxID=118510 RepID=A0A6L2NGS9_TANCI|nr:hypothetical protein [Tanacetum cinerariifolium]
MGLPGCHSFDIIAYVIVLLERVGIMFIVGKFGFEIVVNGVELVVIRIVLSIEDKLNYLEQPIPPAPPIALEGQQVALEILAAYTAWIKGSKEIVGLMEEGQTVSSYVLKMKGYIDNLERLGNPVTLGLGGLRASRKLKLKALSLFVGNGQREAVEVIGVFYLCLSSILEIVLNNFHYAPSITRGVISVSCLHEDGFINRFVNYTFQVSRNNMVYFIAIPRDGIFEIDLSNSYDNDSFMYAISNKRAKLDLDSALLWHCRLGHISKKRIEKLQHDGLLNLTDLRAFEKCISCMSGKIGRNPYIHQVERAKDLLGLIQTDEVEKQLGKTIKSLRSNRGGEYMSQEFLDHLKDHGIITHRTPPYTPQHNGVSDRRNRTLLDMVRSMMSQTTLPKSFLDYALETAARIHNMVCKIHEKYRSLHRIKSKASRILSGPNEGPRLCWTL